MAKRRVSQTIVGYKKDEFNLDQINQGRLLFPLLAMTNDARYRTAIETLRGQLRSQPRTAEGGCWHKRCRARAGPDQRSVVSSARSTGTARQLPGSIGIEHVRIRLRERRTQRADGAGRPSLNGICQVAGLGGHARRDGTFSCYISEPVVADDYKGVAPFIMAALELGR